MLERWRELGGERVAAIALDARLPPELQAELLPLALQAGLACVEVAHPIRGWQRRRAASPISADRGEREAAVLQLQATAQLAAEAGARRVLLFAGRLPLSSSRDDLAHRFALGRPALAGLTEERTALAGPALDHLCMVLDEVLPLCAALSLSLELSLPAAWPDQMPDVREAESLLEVFRGAPLGACFGSDWAEVAGALAGTEPIEARRTPGLGCLRLADACGLRQRLAPGVGEVRFERVLAGTGELDQVLAPGPDVWPAEVAAAVDLLDQLAAPVLSTSTSTSTVDG